MPELNESTNPKPKTLVMAGGGIKGLANAPAFKILDDTGKLDGIENCIGSSVGGLNASMLAMGYSPDEIELTLKTMGDGLLDLVSSSPVFDNKLGMAKAGISNIVHNQSVAKGHALYEACQALTQEKMGTANATFSDLAAKANSGETAEGGKFRHLELTVTVSDKRGNYQIVCSPETTPNMPIALAARMTAGLPPVFPPVKLSEKQLREFTVGATEPLVKYDRGEPFPPFDAKEFYASTPQEQMSKVDEINNDIINHSLKKNGKLYCSDGGVVDNLPVYLALNKEDGKIEETIGFNFEEPWRKEARQKHREMYSKEAEIDQEKEQRYMTEALNIPKNDAAYYLFQKHISDSRLPPSHHLALLQQDNMFCFETGSIEAADFDLASDEHMTHDEKESYLLQSGHKAAAIYLKAKGEERPKKFSEMYPGVEEAPQAIPEQIKTAEEHVSLWAKVAQAASDETIDSELNEERALQFDEIKELRAQLKSELKAAKRSQNNLEGSDQEMGLLLKNITDISNENMGQIIQAKKDCKKELADAVQSLSRFEKFSYELRTKITPFEGIIRTVNPQLSETLDNVTCIRKKSKLLTEMSGLIRDDSLALGIQGKNATLDHMVSGIKGTVGRISGVYKEKARERFSGIFGGSKAPEPEVQSSELTEQTLSNSEQLQKELAGVLEKRGIDSGKEQVGMDEKRIDSVENLPDPSWSPKPVQPSSLSRNSAFTLSFNRLQADVPKSDVTSFYNKIQSIDITDNPTAQIEVQTLCKAAVDSAKPGTEFSIPEGCSEEMKDFVKESLESAIKEAMESEPPRFSEGEEPVIRDTQRKANRM